MDLYLYNPMNVYCSFCKAIEGSYCVEEGYPKAGFHPSRLAEINAIINEGQYSEGSSLSKLAHHFYQREKEPNYRECLESAYKLLSSLSKDKIEILMVLVEEGFEGSNTELIKVVTLL